MEIEILLKNLNLSDKEIAVYLTLIKLGPSPVRVIADQANINRGTTYDILKSLIKEGLATYYHKQTKQYFVAEPPEKLISLLEDRQTKLEYLKDEFKQNMPQLQALFEKSGNRPMVKFYEGNKGMKQILQDVLETMKQAPTKEYFVYSSGTAEERQHLYSLTPDFNKKRVAKNIQVRVISMGESGKTIGLDQRRQLPLTDQADFSMTHEIIYRGKVAHIGLDAGANSVGVVIENDSIYQMQKAIFDFNWQQLH